MNITIAPVYKAQALYSNPNNTNIKYNQNQVQMVSENKTQSFGISLPLILKKLKIRSSLKSLGKDMPNFDNKSRNYNPSRKAIFYKRINVIASRVTKDNFLPVSGLVKRLVKEGKNDDLGAQLTRLDELTEIMRKYPSSKPLIESATSNNSFTFEEIHKLFNNIPEFDENAGDICYRKYNGSKEDNAIVNERIKNYFTLKTMHMSQKQGVSSKLETLKKQVPELGKKKDFSYDDKMADYYISEIKKNVNIDTSTVIEGLAGLIKSSDRVYEDLIADLGDLKVLSEVFEEHPYLIPEVNKTLSYGQLGFNDIKNIFIRPEYKGQQEDVTNIEKEVLDKLLKKSLGEGDEDNFGCPFSGGW